MKFKQLILPLLLVSACFISCEKTTVEEDDPNPWKALEGTWVGDCDWETIDSTGTDSGTYPESIQLTATGTSEFKLILNDNVVFDHRSGNDLAVDSVWFQDGAYDLTRYCFVENGSRLLTWYNVTRAFYEHHRECGFTRQD